MTATRSISVFVVLLVLSIAFGCEFTYKLKTGEEAFDVQQYAVAVQMLSEEYETAQTEQERAKLAYLSGLSYQRMNRTRDAVFWFGRAAEEGFGTEAYEAYAENLIRLEDYERAIGAYQTIMQQTGDQMAHRADITACRQAMQWQEESAKSEFSIEPVPFNSPGSDYAPYVLGPGEVLFTSDRTDGGDTYNWTGRSFSDIYISRGGGAMVEAFDSGINSEHNDGTVALTGDRNTIYFSRCYDSGDYDMYCKLVVAYKIDNQWTEPEPLSFVADGVNYGHPVLSANDSILIFSSNDERGSGGYDLFYSTLDINGWAEPKPLSPRLNTMGNEKFPSLHHDTLYFSSDRHVGMGGLDIFKSYLTADGKWTPPINLKAPVNSGADDFAFVVDTFTPLRGNELMKGFFSSGRGNIDGTDDVYAYEKRRRDDVIAEAARKDSAKIAEALNDTKYELYLAIRVVEPVFADPEDPNSKRIAKRPLSNARVTVSHDVLARRFRTDDGGYLLMNVDYGETYDVEAKFRGFLTKRARFDGGKIKKDPRDPVKTHTMEIVLDPIFVGKEIVLQNIYYDLDKWDIREDARPALNELAEILKTNPGIRIELGSHTDCRAAEDYNQELSQKRAQSAVDYLVSYGINANRMVARGYGESQLAINCVCEECTEEQHQANRRTTFKIVQ